MFSPFLVISVAGRKNWPFTQSCQVKQQFGARVRKVGMGDDLPLRKVNDFGTWEAKRKSHGGRMMQIASYSERYILPLWGRGQTTAFWEWHFSRWNLTNKKHKQLLGIPFDVQLGAPFFVKGGFRCWRTFFFKIPGWSFIRLTNQGEGNELEAISTSALKIRDKKRDKKSGFQNSMGWTMSFH